MAIFPQRKSIRLKKYNYASLGWYFISICTQNREELFGNINKGKMVLNEVGKMIENVWQSLPKHHPVELDILQIMPNHVHFVIQIVGATRGSPANKYTTGGSRPLQTGGSRPAPTTGLGTIVGLFKSECTKQIRKLLNQSNFMVWQRNYWEHIIRTENDLDKIRQYIKINPEIWDRDRNNPKNIDTISWKVYNMESWKF